MEKVIIIKLIAISLKAIENRKIYYLEVQKYEGEENAKNICKFTFTHFGIDYLL